MNARQKMHALKKTKEPTPLDGLHYPLRTIDDAGPLLRERLQQIRNEVDKVFGPGVKMWLFGSQRKGRSASKSPDIDLHLYREDLPQKGYGTYDGFLKVVEALPFKIDLSLRDATEFEIRKAPCVTKIP